MAKRGRKQTKPPRNRSRAQSALPAMTDSPSLRVNAAQQLYREGKRSDAFDLFQEAIRQEPNNVRVYVMAGRGYAQAFEFAKMERVHEKLLARAPNHPGVHHYLGETYKSLKLPARASKCFTTAAELPGALPPTWMELASLNEGSHRLDEAQELIERTVKAGFDLPLVWLVRGKIQRRQQEYEKAEASFHDLIKKYSESDWACQAWGELALMKDRTGDYAGAVDAIAECKRIQRSHESNHWNAAQRSIARVEQFIDDLTSDHFQRWRQQAAELPPMNVALLTGFPRSGTTLLEQVLDAHPGLVSSEERDFVGRELFGSVTARQGVKPLAEILDDLPLSQIAAARKRYLPVMEYMLGEPVGDRVHLDKNPAYNLTLPVMLRFFPETRLVMALRDPRDVVLSCYLRHLPLNAVSVQFLTPERTAERYALDMRAWLKFRKLYKSPWCQVKYEDTVNNMEAEARRALDTLGLEWSTDVLDYRARLGREKQVTSPTYEAVAAPIHSGAIGRWKNYQELLEPALPHLEPYLKEFGYE